MKLYNFVYKLRSHLPQGNRENGWHVKNNKDGCLFIAVIVGRQLYFVMEMSRKPILDRGFISFILIHLF